jgi:hypothetical protein
LSAHRRRWDRVCFTLAALGIGVYAANIAAGMAAGKLGWGIARLNDVWECLVVLVAMVFFVAGLLATEDVRPHEPR